MIAPGLPAAEVVKSPTSTQSSSHHAELYRVDNGKTFTKSRPKHPYKQRKADVVEDQLDAPGSVGKEAAKDDGGAAGAHLVPPVQQSTATPEGRTSAAAQGKVTPPLFLRRSVSRGIELADNDEPHPSPQFTPKSGRHEESFGPRDGTVQDLPERAVFALQDIYAVLPAPSTTLMVEIAVAVGASNRGVELWFSTRQKVDEVNMQRIENIPDTLTKGNQVDVRDYVLQRVRRASEAWDVLDYDKHLLGKRTSIPSLSFSDDSTSDREQQLAKLLADAPWAEQLADTTKIAETGALNSRKTRQEGVSSTDLDSPSATSTIKPRRAKKSDGENKGGGGCCASRPNTRATPAPVFAPRPYESIVG